MHLYRTSWKHAVPNTRLSYIHRDSPHDDLGGSYYTDHDVLDCRTLASHVIGPSAFGDQAPVDSGLLSHTLASSVLAFFVPGALAPLPRRSSSPPLALSLLASALRDAPARIAPAIAHRALAFPLPVSSPTWPFFL